MDTTSLSIGIFIFLLFLTPIVYLMLNQASAINKRKKIIKRIASAHQLELNHQEFYPHFALGLDTKNKKLLIFEAEDAYDIIPLDQVKDSHLSKKLTNEFYKNQKKERIVHLSLELINKLNEKITEIVFYDEQSEDINDAQAQLFIARKWDNLIHASMT